VWDAAAGAALFEENDSVCFRIEEASIVRDQACAWATVQKDNGLSVRIAALLVIQVVNV
jgi:hypothetical protein